MKYTLVLTLIAISAILFVACTPKTNNGGDTNGNTDNGDRTPYQTLANEAYSGVETKQNVVITDDKAWDKLWDDTYKIMDPKPDMPNVNFANETVVGVYLGMKSSGGYGIEVSKIIDTGKEYQVYIKETAPAKGMMSTMALTQPFHLIKFENPENKKIVFRQ